MNFAKKIGANRVVVALSVARLGDAVGNSILFIALPLYVDKLAAPLLPFPATVRVGLLIGVFGIVTAIIQPVMGSLVDAIGQRKLSIQVGLVVMGAATLAFAVAGTFTDLLVLRIVQAIGVALTIPASMAIMTTASEKETRGGSMGIFSTMRIIGFGTGPLVGGYLVDNVGFNAAFIAGAVAILIGFVLVQVWVTDKPVPRPAAQQRPRLKLLDTSVLTPTLFGASFASFAMATAMAMIVTLEPQFDAMLNMSAFAFGVAFSALLVSRLIFQIPLGRLSDRVGRKPIILLGLIALAPATALLGLVGSLGELIMLRVVQGVGTAGVAAPAFALAGDTAAPGAEGRQMSYVTMGFMLGTALGPLLAGLLAVNSIQLPFYIGGVLSLLAAWVSWRTITDSVQRQSASAQTVEAIGQAGDDR